MKRKDAMITCVVFALLIFIPAVLFFALPKKAYSEYERRYLEEKPELSKDTIMDGTFMDSAEIYLSDHFPGRNQMVGLYGWYSKAMLRKDIGGAYLCSDGCLITKLTDSEVEASGVAEKNIEAVSTFVKVMTENGTPVTCLVAPSASLMLPDKLPAFASVYDQNAYLDKLSNALGAQFVDVREVLGEDGDYYKTDHHWITEGAYKAYEAWVDARAAILEVDTEEAVKEAFKKLTALDIVRKRRYEEFTVSEQFRGTLYAKVLSGFQKDTVTAYLDKKNYSVVADGKELTGLYDETKVNATADAYDYFFGGNYALMTIKNEEEGTKHGGHLLVIKDSYANCFLPFLVSEYRQVDVIDLRYYTGSMKQYIAANRVNEVLILYGMDGFVLDKNVNKLTVGLSEDVSEYLYVPRHEHADEPNTITLLTEAMTALGANSDEGMEKAGMDSIYGYGSDILMDNFQSLYGIEPAADFLGDAAICYGNGNANEVSVLYILDESKTATIKAILEKRLERRLRDFEGYMPEEVYKLEQAKVTVCGHYVFLVVSDEQEAITRALLQQMKQ